VDIIDKLALAASLGIALIACGSPPAANSCDTSAAAVARAAEYLIARDNARDLAGVLAGYSDDVTWYPPQDPPLHGIEAIRPRYEDLFSHFAVALRSNVLEASANGDSGFIIGTTQGTLTPLAGGQAVEVNDRFVAIVRCGAVRRHSDGAWFET
jgi:ketosteroid isomerase-like protein